MVNLRRLTDQAKKIVNKRGGTGALKEDADELKDIATSKGSLKDKAKAAGEAIKDPGAPGEQEREPASVEQERKPASVEQERKPASE
jgi:hypothetical protein